jgi:hypothetical protein
VEKSDCTCSTLNLQNKRTAEEEEEEEENYDSIQTQELNLDSIRTFGSKRWSFRGERKF